MVTILCSNWDEDHNVVCDLPLGHKGAHQGTVVWGDESKGASDGNE